MKRVRAGRMLGGALLLLLWGTAPAVLAQHVICCNLLQDVGGKWFGALRTCDLSGVPPARRASLCQALQGCAEAAPYCGVDRPCTEAGSIVDVHNQALGERIRVTGTPFALYYRSDRIQRSQSDSFPNSLAGWSLDVHHAYDSARKILYTGDGRRRIAAMGASQPGGEIRIPAEDGSVLDIFDGKGRHLRTVNALTTAVRYLFVYDAQARLVGVEDGYRNTTRIERDAQGVPTGIVAPGGQRTVLATHPDGHLASVTNPAAETTRLSYSKDGRLSELTDPKGQVHRFSYSSQGALLKDENPAGGHWALARTQTPNGFTVALTSALGRTSTYAIERLSSGEERRVNTGPGGAAVRVETDTRGNEKVIDPAGTVSISEYQPDPRWGALAPFLKSFSISTPGGRTLLVAAERRANLAQAAAPAVQPRDTSRDALGALAPFLRSLPLPGPVGGIAGILAERAAPAPASAPAPPVEPPSLLSVTESLTVNGRAHQRSYDVNKMEWTQTTPAGRQVITGLNAQGRVVRRAAPGILPVSFVYDSGGRVSGISQGTAAQARAVTVSYDAEHRVASIVDPLKRATRFEYDPAGRMTRQIFADGREILFAYDPNGNLTAVTPPGRPPHQFEYTPADRVSSYLAPDASSGRAQTTYSYNQDKQLTRVTRPDTKTIEFDYDTAGRVSGLAIPQGKIRYLFDATTDQLKTITAADGGTLSYEYDGFLPTRVSWSGAIQGDVARTYDNGLRISSLAINGRKPVEYRFDPDGLLTQAGALILERNPRSGAITATQLGAVTTVHSYDDLGRIRRYAARFKDQEIFAVEYERDATGRIIRKIETVERQARTFLYGYDSAGRLSEVKSDSRKTVYEYDANGNRVAHRSGQEERKATYDAQDRLVTYGGATYRYTANGELASRESGGDTAAFDYDVLGNLRSASLSGGPKLEHVIDGANRRVGKKLDGKLVQGFLYADRLKPVAELDGGNNVVGTFVYGTKVNVPEYVEKADGIYRIVTDHLGSPRLAINVETGTIAQKMDYDEFGNVLQDTNPGFQPFGFAGGLHDSHTKLTRFMARDYDASTGRWTAKDPIGFAGGDFNLYGYALNDPVNRTDARGLQVSDEFGIFTGSNWSDPSQTTIVDIDTAGNVSVQSPSNPVDFPLTGGPTPGPSFTDRVGDRFRNGWSVFGDVNFHGPTVNPDRYGQNDPGGGPVAPGTCNDSWTGRNQSQSPYNIPSSPTAAGGVISISF